MDDINLKITLTYDAVIEFVPESNYDFARMRVISHCGIDLIVIRSYRQYLDIMNASKPDWTLQQQHDVYKWMHEVGWLTPTVS